MLRFKIDDLPPHLREQALRQCEGAQGSRKVRPPITMAKKNDQSSPEKLFNALFLGGRGKFEAVTLNLPGGTKYTGDFLVSDWPIVGISRPVICEVKGSYRLKSHARAATAFKAACAIYPEFIFCWAEEQKKKDIWKVTFFHDGKQVGDCREGTAYEILESVRSTSCMEGL